MVLVTALESWGKPVPRGHKISATRLNYQSIDHWVAWSGHTTPASQYRGYGDPIGILGAENYSVDQRLL
jgi:hypothetical protein